MTAAYPPGTVAMVKCSDGEWRQATAGRRYGADAWSFPDGTARYQADSEARPLLVLDPDDDEQMNTLVTHLYGKPDLAVVKVVIAAVRAMLPKPIPTKPPEPTEDGAVVKTREGKFYERVDGAWHYDGDTEYVGRDYDYLDVVAVYLPSSEGER